MLRLIRQCVFISPFIGKVAARTFQQSPHLRTAFWQGVYQFLARRYYHRTDWSMMNYGYVALDSTPSPQLTPAEEKERLPLHLYHHLASTVDLQDKWVLEVGCGRGGGAAFIKRYAAPAQLIGLDFSTTSVSFCQRCRGVDGLQFIPGEAGRLPFAPAQFEALINIESSHCYPSMRAFLAEVARVLRPGGYFLLADFRYRQKMVALRQQLATSGLTVVREQDITANVIESLNQDDARKMALIQTGTPRWLHRPFREFAGVRGSLIYRAFQEGRILYYSFVLRKSPKLL